MTPLRSPKPFAQYSPEEYKQYIESLHIKPVEKLPPAEWAVRLNAKGTPVITVRRKPKWITFTEARLMSKEVKFTYQEILTQLRKKKIEVRLQVVKV